MIDAGADILDIGGESTRPGAEPVSVEEERGRVLPVIEGLAGGGAVLSVDTRHAPIMEAAVNAGAAIINDVTALAGDPGSLDAAARTGASVILMHMQGEPRTMQADPHYEGAAKDVVAALEVRVAAAEAAGIDRARIAVDPGIGFGKTVDHNLDILHRLSLYRTWAVRWWLACRAKASSAPSAGASRRRTGCPAPSPRRWPRWRAAPRSCVSTTWRKPARRWTSGRRSTGPARICKVW